MRMATDTTTVFDAIGRTTAQQNGLGFLTTFVFDAASQQIAVIDANSHAISNAYDLRGSVLSTQDSLGAFTSFAYDAVGNTILRTDARNWPSTYTLDALNRTVGTLYLNATRVTNTFDAAGQQSTMQDLTGITGYTYDLAGRQISVAYPTGKTLTYAFDPIGNRIAAHRSRRRTHHLLLGRQEPNDRHRLALRRPDHHWPTMPSTANSPRPWATGMLISHTYDPDGRETLLGNYHTGRSLRVYTATYDPVGNRLTVPEIDKTLVTFAYDASYQLINEQRNRANAYNTTYTYDPVGNRTVKNDSGALTTMPTMRETSRSCSPRLPGLPTTSSYDANGNLTLENAEARSPPTPGTPRTDCWWRSAVGTSAPPPTPPMASARTAKANALPSLSGMERTCFRRRNEAW